MDDTGPPRMSIEQWLTERLENCKAIAANRVGADQDSWVEDAAYFDATLRQLKMLSLATLTRQQEMREWCAQLVESWDYPWLAREIRAIPIS